MFTPEVKCFVFTVAVKCKVYNALLVPFVDGGDTQTNIQTDRVFDL